MIDDPKFATSGTVKHQAEIDQVLAAGLPHEAEKRF